MKSRPGIVAVVVWVCREGAGRPAGHTRLADATLARKVPLHCQLARQPGCTTDSARQVQAGTVDLVAKGYLTQSASSGQ